MLNYKESLITQNLIKNNSQSTMHNNGYQYQLQDRNIDWTLSYFFTKFLQGQIDNLPDFSVIDEIYALSKERIISIGYGMTVTKKMEIIIEEPVREDITRIDKISADNYTAFQINEIRDNSKAIDIDIEQYPRFDKRRVDILQKYLDSYLMRKREKDEENQKTL